MWRILNGSDDEFSHGHKTVGEAVGEIIAFGIEGDPADLDAGHYVISNDGLTVIAPWGEVFRIVKQ